MQINESHGQECEINESHENSRESYEIETE